MTRSKSLSQAIRVSALFLATVLPCFLLPGCNDDPGDEWMTANPLEIRVTGREFYWHFLYSGPDLVLGTDDDVGHSKDLYVPSGRLVKLLITSDDYIYFFRVPDYRLREAAIPDLVHEISFEPEKIGVSELEVDPMCSARFIHQDGSMGRMHTLGETDFVGWLRKRQAGVESP
ncbi:MAG: hypothetical protein HKN82_06800 [Akkermansiaceae bacterium]|nr:hypothetical protein [Akkermansiaceae bacterium]